MHVIQAQQDLLSDLPDDGHGHAFGLVPLDEPEEVLAEDFEDHADVRAVRACVLEVVEEGDDVGAAWVCEGRGGRGGRGGGGGWGGGGDEPLEELDLVEGGPGVARGGLDDFECDMPVHPVYCKYEK